MLYSQRLRIGACCVVSGSPMPLPGLDLGMQSGIVCDEWAHE